MKIGAAYIRVSTDDQLEYSPDSQLKQIQKYAAEHEITLPSDFIFIEEEGRSGRSAKSRPAFQRMIATAKQKPKPFDVLLLWKFSRFARNREDAILYKSLLRKQCKIEVLSISENIGDDKMSILIEAFIEAMDEWYSINLGEEVKRGMTQRASKGEVVSIAPFGYYINDKHLHIKDEEAAIVRQMYAFFLSGVGYKPIAAWLNEAGIKTHRGNKFDNRLVRYILTNPVYMGKIRWCPNGRTDWREVPNTSDVIFVDGVHQPIVDATTFEAVQTKVLSIKRTHKKYARPGAFLLQGLVRCSNCHSTLVRSSGGLQCTSYAKGLCNLSHYINMDTVETGILSILSSVDIDGVTVHKPTNPPPKADNTLHLLAREEVKLQRVKDAYEEGIDTLDEYKMKKEKILLRITALSQRQQEEPPKITPQKDTLGVHADTLKKLYDPQIGADEKNTILKGFVDEIIFDRKNQEFQLFLYF